MVAHVTLNLLDARFLLAGFGVLGVFLVVFVETGLLIGFFLAGDALLFTAGHPGSDSDDQPCQLPLVSVMVAATASDILGAHSGYIIGNRARGGPPLCPAGGPVG